jgi:hypothetical protein
MLTVPLVIFSKQPAPQVSTSEQKKTRLKAGFLLWLAD